MINSYLTLDYTNQAGNNNAPDSHEILTIHRLMLLCWSQTLN